MKKSVSVLILMLLIIALLVVSACFGIRGIGLKSVFDEDAIRKGARGLLKDVALFDIYTGVGIAPGKKSVAFSLTLRADDRSLPAEEADEDVKSILESLRAECGAELR